MDAEQIVLKLIELSNYLNNTNACTDSYWIGHDDGQHKAAKLIVAIIKESGWEPEPGEQESTEWDGN